MVDDHAADGGATLSRALDASVRVAVRKHDNKLLTSEATDDVLGAERFSQECAEGLQDRVARGM